MVGHLVKHKDLFQPPPPTLTPHLQGFCLLSSGAGLQAPLSISPPSLNFSLA